MNTWHDFVARSRTDEIAQAAEHPNRLMSHELRLARSAARTSTGTIREGAVQVVTVDVPAGTRARRLTVPRGVRVRRPT